MKVLLLALVTSLFSLSITPIHKTVAKADLNRISCQLRSLYHMHSMFAKYNHGNRLFFACNLVNASKQDNVNYLSKPFEAKSLKIQNPHF